MPPPVINVSSIPKRSVFRYPGGKTWLVPYIREWLRNSGDRHLIEPFAGGGIVGLTAAFESLVADVLLVELDSDIACVWKAILDGNWKWLADEITGFEMCLENVVERLAQRFHIVISPS